MKAGNIYTNEWQNRFSRMINKEQCCFRVVKINSLVPVNKRIYIISVISYQYDVIEQIKLTINTSINSCVIGKWVLMIIRNNVRLLIVPSVRLNSNEKCRRQLLFWNTIRKIMFKNCLEIYTISKSEELKYPKAFETNKQYAERHHFVKHFFFVILIS